MAIDYPFSCGLAWCICPSDLCMVNLPTFTLTHHICLTSKRPDTRQAGFCRPSIHQQKNVKGRDLEISQATRPSKLKEQVNKKSRDKQNEPRRQQPTKQLGEPPRGPLNHNALSCPSNSAKYRKGPSRKGGKTQRNIAIHRNPSRANTERRQASRMVDQTPKQTSRSGKNQDKPHSQEANLLAKPRCRTTASGQLSQTCYPAAGPSRTYRRPPVLEWLHCPWTW